MKALLALLHELRSTCIPTFLRLPAVIHAFSIQSLFDCDNFKFQPGRIRPNSKWLMAPHKSFPLAFSHLFFSILHLEILYATFIRDLHSCCAWTQYAKIQQYIFLCLNHITWRWSVNDDLRFLMTSEKYFYCTFMVHFVLFGDWQSL